MRFALPPTLLRAIGLAVAAAVAALLSNALRPPARRLAWFGSMMPMPPIPPASTPAAAPQPSTQTPPDLVRAHVPPSPVQPVKPRAASVQPPAVQQAVSPDPIREISSQEAWAAFQAGAPFLDARRSAEFAEGHVAGAWNSPVWEADVDDRLLSFKAARHPGPEDPIVIYCSGGDCRDSHLLAAKLLNEGYFHLLIYRAGFPDWVTQGRPIGKGQP